MRHLSGYAKDVTSQLADHAKTKVKTSLIDLEQKLVSKNSVKSSDDERGLLRKMSEAALVEVIRTVTRGNKDGGESSDGEGDEDGVLFGSLRVFKPK